MQFDQGSHIAHGFDHAERVAIMARHIAKAEDYDPELATVAGYLHDIGRTVQKGDKNHGPAGVDPARKLLDEFTNYDDSKKGQVLDAVRDHSKLEMDSKLTQIVQDADMLDGLGLVGIMRAYTSKAHLACYGADRTLPPKSKLNGTIHEQIAYQMEWVGFMHTHTGKSVATLRHNKMYEFLKEFEKEVERQDFPKL